MTSARRRNASLVDKSQAVAPSLGPAQKSTSSYVRVTHQGKSFAVPSGRVLRHKPLSHSLRVQAAPTKTYSRMMVMMRRAGYHGLAEARPIESRPLGAGRFSAPVAEGKKRLRPRDRRDGLGMCQKSERGPRSTEAASRGCIDVSGSE